MSESILREGKYFEEFKIGETIIAGGRTISRADLNSYISISGNDSETHMNKITCQESGHPDQVVHGGILFAIQDGLAGSLMQAATGSLYGYDRIRFTSPVYPGDTLSLAVTIKDKEEYDKKRGLVVFERKMNDQNDELCMIATSKHLVLKKPHE